ncbi:uncharacterized protein LOC143919151 [Arctopsyche grandis]|uniref:uncharacterized protein LOC143919151 n=1 Tax=Arctopsyche grandis TaxID=121162 RepID=UPI00406DA181
MLGMKGISSSSSSSKPSRIFRKNKIHRAEQRQAFQKILRLDESKFLLYASTTKCSYDHFHQAFQKILRLDESKFLLYASTTKCSYDHFHQAFQKILRLDKSAFLSYASTTKCSYASITTSIKRSRKFYASTKVHSFLTHQQTTTIGQAIPETL